jgi:ribosomal protein S18 acetylase RimI-like enzyme
MDAEHIILRDYRESDIPVMLAVIKESFGQYRGRIDPPSSAERKTIEIMTAELARANALVIQADGQVVGCVLFRTRDGGIYFERLSVLPAYRNQGLARLMLEEIERRALSAGKPMLWFSVRLELTELQEFYKRVGFEFQEFGTHSGFDRPTYMKMRKWLVAREG